MSYELFELVDVRIVFRYDCCLGTAGDGAVLGEEAGIAAHYLYEEYPVVAGRRVPYLVNAFHYGVEGGVVTYGVVRAVEVIVNCSGQAYAGYVIFLGKGQRSCQGAVSSDDDEGVYPLGLYVLIRFRPAFGSGELLASGALEYGSSSLYGVGYAFSCEIDYLIFNQACITAVYAFYLPSLRDGSPGDGPDAGVHSGSVTTRGEHSDACDFFHPFVILQTPFYLKNYACQ